jgi:hypothetical protein
MSDLADPKGPWASAIGRAFVAFGSIEFITLHCLYEIPKDRIRRSIRSFKLGQRIELIQELLEAHPGQLATALHDALQRAKQLTPTRNLIAHSPIFVDFYKHKDGSLLHTQRIRSVVNHNRTLTLAQLEQFADDAESVCTSLYETSSDFINMLRGGPAA